MPSDYAKKKAQKKKEAAKQKGGKKPKETESGNFYPQFFLTNSSFTIKFIYFFLQFYSGEATPNGASTPRVENEENGTNGAPSTYEEELCQRCALCSRNFQIVKLGL